MAELYTDHNVAAQIADLLRAHGHSVVTARELRLESAKDDEHLFIAAQRGWVLVTHDAHDFALLHDALQRWGATPQHAGILVVPQPPRWPHNHTVGEIHRLLLSNQPLIGELYRWRPAIGWVRRL